MKDPVEVWVSLSDPKVRVIKHGDQAIGPAYDLQITTDAQEKVVVGTPKMQRREAQQLHRPRGAVAVFPNARIRDQIKLWKFRLQGIKKAAAAPRA